MKLIRFVCLLLGMLLLFCGCSQDSAQPTQATGLICTGGGPLKVFYSQEDCLDWFREVNGKGSADYLRQSGHSEHAANWLWSIASGTTPLLIPCTPEGPLTIDAISLYENGAYGFPYFIFSYPMDNEFRSCINVEISYLPEEYRASAKTMTCSAFISHSFPNAPNIHNYQHFENYDAVTEETIEVQGNQVTAMVLSEADRAYLHIKFLLGDNLITLSGPMTTIPKHWIRQLRFEAATIPAPTQ